MDVDAAQYASISREMMEHGNVLQVLHRGQNYLDKPPLLFWLSALSFKLFGVSNLTYKLPTFLFTLLGVYSTFRIGNILYNRITGVVAAIVVYTTQAFFLFNNDVRTDALLTANVAFACWQLIEYSNTKKWQHLLLGFAGVALAMMSKGPIGAVVPAAALLSHLAFRREPLKLLWWQWYAGIAFALTLLLPMLYGLYEQYGNEGPVFFFWTQSFGRITGENVWHNDAGYFYFIHNFGWSFLPWTLPAVFAFVFSIYNLLKGRFRSGSIQEVFSLGGFLLPFIALSLSHYKLPHYIFVVYPLAAVFTAGFLCNAGSRFPTLFRVAGGIQFLIAIILLAGAVYLSTVIFPGTDILLWAAFILGVGAVFYSYIKTGNRMRQLIVPSAFAAILVNLLLSAHVYPALLKYQFGSEMAFIVHRERIPVATLHFYQCNSHSFEFYVQSIVPSATEDELHAAAVSDHEYWVIGNKDLLQLLQKDQLSPQKVFEVNDYSVTLLSEKFLNPATRESTLKKMYLVKL